MMRRRREILLRRELFASALVIGTLGFSAMTQGCASVQDRTSKTFEHTNSGITLFSAQGRVTPPDLILVAPFGQPLEQSSPQNPSHPSEAWLMNLNGKIEMKWKLPDMALGMRLSETGLLYALMLVPPNANPRPRFLGECYALVSVDSDGQVKKVIEYPGITHDFTFLPDGKIAAFVGRSAPFREFKSLFSNPKTDFSKVPSILFTDDLIVFDCSKQNPKDCTVAWRWNVLEHHRELPKSWMFENQLLATNANSIQYVRENPITNKPAFLVSYRNLDVVFFVEYPSGKIVWHSEEGLMSRQHDATWNGKSVLVYNNGLFNTDPPQQQVLEIDPIRNNVLRSWTSLDFVGNSTMGGARALSNGHWLISNSNSGLLLEVDPSRDIDRGEGLIWNLLLFAETRPDKRFHILGSGYYRAEVYSASMLKKAQIARHSEHSQ